MQSEARVDLDHLARAGRSTSCQKRRDWNIAMSKFQSCNVVSSDWRNAAQQEKREPEINNVTLPRYRAISCS